ncbi:hypothetical protein AA313_de0209323 [Arthrobotrys entomopaga]|nr:hypothetical protein AA313_de0209323 [Arthrobotrys entomopaga]
MESKKEDICYGLTCHHVALPTKTSKTHHPSSEDSGSDDGDGNSSGDDIPLTGFPEYLETPGISHGPFQPENGAVILAQPACRDHKSTLRALQRQKKQTEEALNDVIESYMLMGQEPPTTKIIIYEIRLATCVKGVKDIPSSNRKFGTLAATS